MTELTHAFLVDQLRHLGSHEFVTIGFSNTPLVAMEIGRTESSDLEVRVPPRLPTTPLTAPMRNKLLQAGFTSGDPANPLEPWIRPASDVETAIQSALTILREVFDATIDNTVNLLHGSHRAEHEANQRLDELRDRVGSLLAAITGHQLTMDAEGDFICPFDHTQVIIAPRVAPGAISLVRVIAITNTGVNVSPDLGLMLARLNFGLMFGRFALDVEHRAILFDETLLGDDITVDQLRFTIDVVAETTSQWDARFQQMFGGRTHQDFEETERQAVTKPGNIPSPYL
ncbi:MAG: YbjN domain-containing protein [Acidimicrobiia bacterium]|nr:YbjN domain-containing protein [Acidimicrobiia bacterium]